MNTTNLEADLPEPNDYNNSLNCVDVIIDSPGDMTVRPLTGKRRELALAERERLRPWLELLMRQHEQGESTVDVDVVD